MTKGKCPIEEYCLKNNLTKCPLEKICHNDYKKICKFNRKLVNGIKFKILDFDKREELNKGIRKIKKENE